MKSLSFYLLLIGCIVTLSIVIDPALGAGLVCIVAGTTLMARALGK